MIVMRQMFWALLCVALTRPLAAEQLPAPTWNDVQPVFVLRCTRCHSATGAAKGLKLDSYEAVLAGSEDGPVVLAGNALGSELVRRIRGESVPRMPFLSVPLPEDELDLIVRWIEDGVASGTFAE